MKRLLRVAAALTALAPGRPLLLTNPAAGADGPTMTPPPAPPILDDEDGRRQILDLIRAGNKIGATYLQQQLTGDGFNQARSTIESLAARIGGDDRSSREVER